MSFKDLGRKGAGHVDTPAQAEARAQAAADVKTKTDAKAARAAAHREGKRPPDAAKPGSAPKNAKEKKGGPTQT